VESEWLNIVEGLAPYETEEKPAYTVGAGDVGALTNLGTFAPTDQESKMMGVLLDQLAPSQGAAQDE
jgi:hypothetical protein